MTPIFEYHCEKCLISFDRILPKGVPYTKCEKCGYKANKKVTYPGNFHIKGDNSGSTATRRTRLRVK